MMKFVALYIAALTFWSTLAVSQDLQSTLTTTTIAATPRIASEDPVSASVTDISVDVPVPGNSTDPSMVNPDEKQIRLQCGPLSLFVSDARTNVWYLRGVCSGVWNTFHTTRCSYLDLNLCYTNHDGTLKPAPRGGFGPSCYDCQLFEDRGNHMMKCNCDPGHDEDNLIESTVNLEDTLNAENGFLSCFGMTNFECPQTGEEV